MSVSLDIAHLGRFGWMRIEGAVPVQLCERLVEILEAGMDVPVHDRSRWHEYGGEPHDLIPIWGHQAQWDIRQHPDLHRIWTTLWRTDRLGVSLDSCRFTPPWKPGFAEPYRIHWDYDPWKAATWQLEEHVLRAADRLLCHDASHGRRPTSNERRFLAYRAVHPVVARSSRL